MSSSAKANAGQTASPPAPGGQGPEAPAQAQPVRQPGAVPEESHLVAAVIAAHPHVAGCRIDRSGREAALGGTPLGPRLRAEVTLCPGIEAGPETATGLAQWCLGRLPPNSRPAVFVLWEVAAEDNGRAA